MVYDFGGYATKNALKCSDGRTIVKDAFKHNDGLKVPLVWQHKHDDPENVLGHAVLENREDGVYAHCTFNNTPKGQTAKELVRHEDIKAMSIYANQLKQRGADVIHGFIREVSLVIAGANPGAMIDNLSFEHSDGEVVHAEDEAIIYTGLKIDLEDLEHAESDSEDDGEGEDAEETVEEIFNTLSDKQKDVVFAMMGDLLEKTASGEVQHSDDEQQETSTDDQEDLEHSDTEGNTVTHNLFEAAGKTMTGSEPEFHLTHDQLSTIFEEGKKNGSFKGAVLAHAEEYGITNIELLFPDAKSLENKPEWITRRMDWVEKVLNGARKVPWSRIKSWSADLTHEEARAKGYIKGTMKKEQFFEIAFRETGPKTVYKKQRLDQDDIIDITEMDVVAWLWVEMNFMLREEIARAILVGDGREIDDPDKIDETKIRPIATDEEFYTDVVIVPAEANPNTWVEYVGRARENYEGTGEPTAFMTRKVFNDMFFLKDRQNRRLYRTKQDLADELEVSDIIFVPVMEGAMTDDGSLLMVIVNLADYSIGSTRGGEITKYEDFDIDFNQKKMLIEGRMSGALTKHKTAQVVVRAAGTSVTPEVPGFVASTGVITIPTVTGVTYHDASTGDALTAGAQTALDPGETFGVEAQAATGYFFPHNFDADWEFTRDSA